MAIRISKDAKERSSTTKSQLLDGNKGNSNHITGLLILVIVACITAVSFHYSTTITSQFKVIGNIRFDTSYASGENLVMQFNNDSTTPLSSSEIQAGAGTDTDINASGEIQLLLPPDQIEWMKSRAEYFDSFYEIPFNAGEEEEKLHAPADKKGPILDFVVAGFPKCGTTTLMANLGQLAPMPDAQDVCTPARRTVLYSYKNWPPEYGQLKLANHSTSPTTIESDGKLFRSSKCPQFIEEGWVQEFDKFLPKTKLIVGIRHPVLWFLSFWRMQDKETPYELMGICHCNVNEDGLRRGKPGCRGCRGSCPNHQLFCLGRARFHLPLARLGKTALSKEERQLLAPNDIDGGENLVNFNISNALFLYEQTELREGYLWKKMSDFLGVSHIPHRKFKGSAGHGRNYTLCSPHYDDFRAALMPYSYELSVWMLKYFLPVANDPNRPDVVVADVERLSGIVKSYADDPCDRLIRTVNGTFVLKPD